MIAYISFAPFLSHWYAYQSVNYSYTLQIFSKIVYGVTDLYAGKFHFYASRRKR